MFLQIYKGLHLGYIALHLREDHGNLREEVLSLKLLIINCELCDSPFTLELRIRFQGSFPKLFVGSKLRKKDDPVCIFRVTYFAYLTRCLFTSKSFYHLRAQRALTPHLETLRGSSNVNIHVYSCLHAHPWGLVWVRANEKQN